MRKLGTYVGGALVACIFIAGFFAYFVTSVSQDGEQRFDGLGRALSDAPMFMRLLFGQDRLWAGWAWFAGDMMIFWGGLAIGFALINLGGKSRNRQS